MRTQDMSKYIVSKIDNNRYCKTNGQFTKHLARNSLTYREYYEKYVTYKQESCYCGKPKTFYQKSETYANSCGDPKCVGNTVRNVKNLWSAEKKQVDSENKKNAAKRKSQVQRQSQLEKSRHTQQLKYGDLFTRTDLFKTKSKQTKLARYGNEFYSGWDKSAKINRSKSIEEQNEINNKRRITNLHRFGIENCFMLPDVIKKSMQSNSNGKDYTLPSGTIVGIRGYENIALDTLLEQYNEYQLRIDDRHSVNQLPVFKYVNVNQHLQNYYPDIYIPHENKIIEIKSQWWWDGNGDPRYRGRLENNNRKARAVVAAGYTYEVWLFTDKKTYEILAWN